MIIGGTPPGLARRNRPRRQVGEPEDHLGREVVGAALDHAERRLEQLVLACDRHVVQPVEVELLVVDRVRELVREDELLDAIEVGVADVDRLLCGWQKPRTGSC